MNTFEVIIVALTAIGLLGGIISVWIKTQIDLAKITVSITFLQKDLDRKELAILNLEKENKEDHKLMFQKFDKIIDNVKK